MSEEADNKMLVIVDDGKVFVRWTSSCGAFKVEDDITNPLQLSAMLYLAYAMTCNMELEDVHSEWRSAVVGHARTIKAQRAAADEGEDDD